MEVGVGAAGQNSGLEFEVRNMTALKISKLLFFVISTSVAASAQVCVPPSGFVDTPRPAIADAKELGAVSGRGPKGRLREDAAADAQITAISI